MSWVIKQRSMARCARERVGTILVVVPLIAIGVVAINKASRGLTAVENEQLAARSADIAQMLDRIS